jgi:hypothetical protein
MALVIAISFRFGAMWAEIDRRLHFAETLSGNETYPASHITAAVCASDRYLDQILANAL